MNNIVANWIKQAESDLDGAKYNLEGGRNDISVFLSQQGAEKALKALYIQKHDELWRTHDLVKLANLLDAPEGIVHMCN